MRYSSLIIPPSNCSSNGSTVSSFKREAAHMEPRVVNSFSKNSRHVVLIERNCARRIMRVEY